MGRGSNNVLYAPPTARGSRRKSLSDEGTKAQQLEPLSESLAILKALQTTNQTRATNGHPFFGAAGISTLQHEHKTIFKSFKLNDGRTLAAKLRKLAKKSYVEIIDNFTTNGDKKLYRITDSGEDLLESA